MKEAKCPECGLVCNDRETLAKHSEHVHQLLVAGFFHATKGGRISFTMRDLPDRVFYFHASQIAALLEGRPYSRIFEYKLKKD